MEATMTALNMIAQGKRNMVCGEIPTAVNQFQEACKVLSKSYGETAKECAEAYYQYGRALLDLARMETGVLGNALQGVPEEEDGEKSADEQFEKGDMEVEDRHRLRAEVVDAMSEKELAATEKEQKGDNKDEEKKEVNDEEKDKLKDEGKDVKKDEKNKLKDEEKDVKKDEKDELKDEEKDVKMDAEKDKLKGEEKDDKTEEKKNEKEESMDTDDVVKGTKEVSSENMGKDEKEKLDDKKDEKKLAEKKKEEKKEVEKTKKEEKKDESKPKDGELEKKDKKLEGESSSTKNSTEDEEEGEEGTGEEGTEEEGTEDDEDESEAVDTAEEGDNSQEEGSQGEKGEENADDISNLQLAWEMLELAKVIYLKDEDKEAKLKAADAYLKLGEVSLETEQYAQSVLDFTACLNIQKSVLDPDDRSLAETYYQLGLAYSFNKEYDESIDSFRAAVKVMESKIESLQKCLDDDKFPPPKEGSFDDPKKLAEQEINDLKEILPDIRGKVEEVKEERRQIDELKKMAKEGMSVITESLGLQKPEEKSKDEPKKPVSDISHLIRRKRKPDEDEEPEAKKTRQENGSGDAPPKVNGVDKDTMDVDAKKAENDAAKQSEAVAS
ncbi:protein HGV2-like isoform X2 [Pecten maximus]|nr:protein HGV2-like isoform X2 [Pecten maximus]XP_033736646.1 protein HGV2-like isoform X2 [Pecten maximus]